MEADLIFDVLLYLNVYYFPVYGIGESFVVCAKYVSSNLWTPDIGNDAAVVGGILSSEILKLILYRKLRDNRKGNKYLSCRKRY